MEKQLVAIEKRSEEVVKKEALLASKTAALETWEKVGGGGEGWGGSGGKGWAEKGGEGRGREGGDGLRRGG
jgi:hypothetical protein